MSGAGTVVWIGSWQDVHDTSHEVARWSAEDCMAAMQALYGHYYPGAQLTFEQNTMLTDDEVTGYASGEYRWEADTSRVMADGRFHSEWVYIEPFLIPPKNES